MSDAHDPLAGVCAGCDIGHSHDCVYANEIAQLRAENERLKAECAAKRIEPSRNIRDLLELRAQVETLTRERDAWVNMYDQGEVDSIRSKTFEATRKAAIEALRRDACTSEGERVLERLTLADIGEGD